MKNEEKKLGILDLKCESESILTILGRDREIDEKRIELHEFILGEYLLNMIELLEDEMYTSMTLSSE
jgi:hypothetical protein